MIDSGLKKAAAYSLGAHIVLIIATFITIGRTPSFQMPSPYTVRLVSPDASTVKALRVPPKKKHVPLAKEEEAAAEKPSVKTVKAPPPKATEDLTKYSEDKIAALRAKKERERDREAKEQALADIRKREKVKEIGEAKASVTITATAEAGGDREGIVGDYTDMVGSLIQQEWIYFDVKAEDIFAIITVRVLKNGTLKFVEIDRSSGDAIFDRSALRAIEKASPVPPPPYEMELGVRFIPLND